MLPSSVALLLSRRAAAARCCSSSGNNGPTIAMAALLLRRHLSSTTPPAPASAAAASAAAAASSSSSSSSPGGFDKLGIIGLGLMGHGIAQTAALASAKSSSSSSSSSSSPLLQQQQLHPSGIIAYESDQSFLDRGRDRILASVDKLVSRKKLTPELASSVIDKITFTTDIDALIDDTDLIVEAIIEDVSLKCNLYKELGGGCKEGTVFASNTSSLSITRMALASGRPGKFVGVHFFNPVQIMRLVEIVKTEYTDDAVFDRTVEWVKDIGKVGVKCRDTPGFIVNRLLVPNLVQAILLVERGDASIEDVDLSMQLGAGHPMGPLHLADYVGLDTCLYIMEGWVKDFPDERAFVVPDILREKVAKNELGRKTGRGFYSWEGEKRGDPIEQL